jgi:hypothetical protein
VKGTGGENRGAEILGGEQGLQETVQGGAELVSVLSSAADLEVTAAPHDKANMCI